MATRSSQASSAEIVYTLQGAAEDLREDGRARLDFRHLSLELGLLPQTSGSARVLAGGAEVLAAVVAVLSVPDAETPKLGRIVIAVGCGPGVSAAQGLPEYAAGTLSADDKRLWLEGALAQLYGPQSAAVALSSLCIVPGQQCWELRVHVQLTRTDGCPLDAAALAVRAALHDTRVPKVVLRDAAEGATASSARDTAELELDESLDDAVPFAADNLPLYLTLATMDGYLVADCTAKERRAAGTALSVGIDGHGHVCSVCMGGGYGVPHAALATTLREARQLCGQFHDAAREAIAQAAASSIERGGATADHGVGMAAGLLST